MGQHGIQVKVKTGVETFDAAYREQVLCKGIDETSPERIAACFDEACLLFGLPGQTEASMRKDLMLALTYFERACINIMVANTSRIQPDPQSSTSSCGHSIRCTQRIRALTSCWKIRTLASEVPYEQ